MSRIITVNASKKYNCIIDTGLIPQAGSLIKEVLPKASKLLVVSDSNVYPLHFPVLKESLLKEGYEVYEYVFEAGERSKNIGSIAGMWEVMAEAGFTRTDAVVSLGGGVAGDMSGFAAASFLRGINIVQIPTSLLAMVDATVGGKTGIDLPKGKNLVGAFKQPVLVIEDTDVLKTLPEETFTEGMAEVIKYAFIMDTKLYKILKDVADSGKAAALREDTALLTDIVEMCVRDKAEVVEEDEFDTGRRQLLNFGHTIGHVIERNSNFTLSHGEAVAKGMGLISDASLRAGLCSEEVNKAVKDLIIAYNLPCGDSISPEDAVSGVMNDKKKRGNTISLILVNKIGEGEIYPVTPDALLDLLKK